MDPLLLLLAGLAGVLGTLGLMGVLVRRGTRQLAVADAYRVVAVELGLSVDHRGMSLRGVVDGRSLWIGTVLVGHGPERRHEVHAVLRCSAPLAMGLDIRPRPRRWGRRVPVDGPALGDDELDKRLRLQGRPEAAALINAEVRGRLQTLLDWSPDVRVVDNGLRLRLRHAPARPVDLRRLVDDLRAAAAALEAARDELDAPAPVGAVLPLIRSVAATHGLVVRPKRVMAAGAVGGVELAVMPAWGAHGVTLRVAVDLSLGADLGLRLSPATDDGTQGLQDLLVGDPPFDDAFIVRGYDPEAVRQRLHPSLRTHLLRLAALGRVVADEHGIEVLDLPAEREGVDEVISRLTQLVPLA